MPGLLVHLVTLREEAAEQLAQQNRGERATDLHRRFTDWVPVHIRKSDGTVHC
ncbi:hypothetical protein ACGF7U_06530 [Micromonospora sp. NPDC047670]|uniref:hypothetical protein n=1 Tax=Micromonospora sp. NPDC047670 TaxID=3364252 RepID=UPI00371B7660